MAVIRLSRHAGGDLLDVFELRTRGSRGFRGARRGRARRCEAHRRERFARRYCTLRFTRAHHFPSAASRSITRQILRRAERDVHTMPCKSHRRAGPRMTLCTSVLSFPRAQRRARGSEHPSTRPRYSPDTRLAIVGISGATPTFGAGDAQARSRPLWMGASRQRIAEHPPPRRRSPQPRRPAPLYGISRASRRPD